MTANRGSNGIGSATVVLMFTVLCMAIFALISHTAAQNEKALADAEAELVAGYYNADALAERVAAQVLAAEEDLQTLLGVDITRGWDEALAAPTAEYVCGISERKELYVKLALYDGAYEVLIWRMRDIAPWQPEGGLPVWPGSS